MTDKLICPFCGEKLSLEFEPSIMAWCINDKCEHAGVKYSIYVHRMLKQAAVLQKKLDKAMDALNELKDGHVQGSEEMIKLWAQVTAEAAIKEIEDIKEA